MLNIQAVNHIGIRIRMKERAVAFYALLGFEFTSDTGFEKGHPIVMRHPSGVVINLLGPANSPEETNVLMDIQHKHTGITHIALTVESLEEAKAFLAAKGIELTGSFRFGGMSAVFIRDPDRNVIELDAYEAESSGDMDEYSKHL